MSSIARKKLQDNRKNSQECFNGNNNHAETNNDFISWPAFKEIGLSNRQFQNRAMGTYETPLVLYHQGTAFSCDNQWSESKEKLNSKPTAAVLPTGILSLQLRENLRVEMTIDRAIRVFNTKYDIVLAVSAAGDAAALIHPNGRVYQYGSRVEILAQDLQCGNHKFAKMWHKGVSFTSEECALVYLVDSAGTRTTTDSFTDMTKDFSITVFYSNAQYGVEHIKSAIDILKSSQYWISEDGSEHWIINNLRITQAADGLLRIARSSHKYQIRTSPMNGTASLTTPFVHTTASQGSTSHLFVRRGERRMHFDGASFIVRNAGHSAGFDDKNQLKVY